MSKLREAIKTANKLLNVKIPYIAGRSSKEKLTSILILEDSLLTFIDRSLWHIKDEFLTDDDLRKLTKIFKRVEDDDDVKYDVDTDYFLSLEEKELDQTVECLSRLYSSFKEIADVVRISDDEEEKVDVKYKPDPTKYEKFEDSEIYKFMLIRLTADSIMTANPVIRHLVEKECQRLNLPFMNYMYMSGSSNSGTHSNHSFTSNENRPSKAFDQMMHHIMMSQMMGGSTKIDPLTAMCMTGGDVDPIMMMMLGSMK